MQLAKVLTTSFKPNPAGIPVLTVVAEIRKGQNITAEYINPSGEFSTPVLGDVVIVAPRAQTSGGFLAWGYIDAKNHIQADRGVKILTGRDFDGRAQTKLTLTDSDVFLENADAAGIGLIGDEIYFNAGEGSAIEHERLQEALNNYTRNVLIPEFQRVAAGTEPNPSAPYVPSADLPIDIQSAKSDSIKLP